MVNKAQKTQTYPLVSVVVTCYNYAEYVKEAVDSIFVQTYQNIEAIVINDGSTDDSDQVIKELNRQYPITYINQENKGAPAARNTGIKQAKGAFVLFLDADDILPENYIASCVKKQQKTGADIIYCNSQYFGDRHDKTDFPEFDKTHIFYSNFISATALIHAKLFEGHQYDNHLRNLRFDDWDFYLSCINDGATASLNKDAYLLYRIKQKARSNIAIEKQIEAYKYITAKYKKDSNYAYARQLTVSYMDMLVDSLSENRALGARLTTLEAKQRDLDNELTSLYRSKEYQYGTIVARWVRIARHPLKATKNYLSRHQ